MVSTTDQEKAAKETSLQYLKRLLKVDVALSAWDFNSTTLAQQLTMVDRDLFLKISGIELGVLVSQQSSKNAPNVAAMVAFAHRISCLVASDILKNQSERVGRAAPPTKSSLRVADEGEVDRQVRHRRREVPQDLQLPLLQDRAVRLAESRDLPPQGDVGLRAEEARQQIPVGVDPGASLDSTKTTFQDVRVSLSALQRPQTARLPEDVLLVVADHAVFAVRRRHRRQALGQDTQLRDRQEQEVRGGAEGVGRALQGHQPLHQAADVDEAGQLPEQLALGLQDERARREERIVRLLQTSRLLRRQQIQVSGRDDGILATMPIKRFAL
jgi:hypothetical protein